MERIDDISELPPATQEKLKKIRALQHDIATLCVARGYDPTDEESAEILVSAMHGMAASISTLMDDSLFTALLLVYLKALDDLSRLPPDKKPELPAEVLEAMKARKEKMLN